jgi:hypothetical protein
LLDDIGLTDGQFESRTVVIGRPNAHNSAVLNVGSGPPSNIRIDLIKRNNWEELKKRLVDEGF